MDIEPSFPRGGKIKPKDTATEKPLKRKQDDDLFGKSGATKSSKKSKDAKKKDKKADSGFDLNLKIKTVDPLNYKVMSEGMMILGCIREIHRYHMMVSLPGKTVGRVPITAISKQYSALLESADETPMLSDLFHPGQYVVTRVTSIAAEGSYHQIGLTIAPDEIHAELTHSSVKEGMVLTGAVSSIEDHGYLIDFGINNLKAFLKNDKAAAYTEAIELDELIVGQLIRCLVTKVKNAVASTMAELNADPDDVNEAVIAPSTGINPHLVIPGMKFDVNAIMPLNNGALIKWLKFDGYVHTDYFPDPDKPVDAQFTEESLVTATVLYSLPLVRLVYFSMQEPAPFNMPLVDTSLESTGVPTGCDIQLGDVIDAAQVLAVVQRGLTLKLKKGNVRGFVHTSQLPKLGDGEDLQLKYPLGTRVQCRVLKYDCMDRVFLCTMIKEKISDKVLIATDVKPGTIVSCVITEVRKKDLIIQINNWHHLKARVPSTHLTDTHISDISKRFTKGQRIKGRVLYTDTEKDIIHVTLKPSWVNSQKPILASYDNVPTDKFFDGVVVCIQPKFYLVSFYNDVTGKLNLDRIPSELNSKFVLGQTISVRVARSFPNTAKIFLTMSDAKEKIELDVGFEVGREYNAVVSQVLNREIHLKISVKGGEGFGKVPEALVSVNKTLASSSIKTFSPGDKVKATCLLSTRSKNVFTIDSELAHTLKFCITTEPKDLALLSGVVSHIGKTGVFLSTVTRTGDSKLLLVTQKSLADQPIEDMKQYFTQNQALLYRVESLAKEKDESTFKVPIVAVGSTKLMDVCPYGVPSGGYDIIQNYMAAYVQIFNKLKKEKHALSTYQAGQMVEAKISAVSGGVAEIQLDGGVQGFISKYHCHGSSFKVGQKINAAVIWVDMGSMSVQLSVRPDILKQIHKDQTSCPKPKEESTQRGEVIHVTEDVVIVTLKGQCRGLIACAPARTHINDLTPEHYQLGAVCKFVFKSTGSLIPICVNKRHLPTKGKKPKLHPGSLERKIRAMDENKAKLGLKRKHDDDSDVEECETVQLKSADEIKVEREVLDAPDDEEELAEVVQDLQSKPKKFKPTARETLSVPDFVWDPTEVKKEDDESSSEDEEEEEAPKKKLTAAERREMARKEEEKLVKAEQKLMDEEQAPQSADDFDRLIMATPDSSILWVQYMAFHLQATEIEKARAVARKAFKTISFREEQEKLNVWVALLNLENLYGTPESLESTLQEAVQMNDASKVYTQMLKIFTDTNKIEEGNSLFDTMLRKFRSDKETWVQGGTFYFQTNQLEKGRHLLQRALRSLENKNHVDVICRFAHLENKFGSPERCHTLFEHILSSYPKRTDIWSSYADLLIKAGNVDAARNLLERATVQKLPVRKMKVLFKKYLEFAQQNGTEEEVEAVKAKAQQFVLSVAANMPADDDSDAE